jgi:Lipase (class 3)
MRLSRWFIISIVLVIPNEFLISLRARACYCTTLLLAQLYVTGHSLGGALATLFAFQAAALPDTLIPKPVSLFSFGAPYVGDDSFRDAFRLLESQGKLRYCRVTNQKDMVPLVPKVSFKFAFYEPDAHVGATYKHVGMNLRFFGDTTPFEILYPKVRTGWMSSFYDEMYRGWEQTLFSNWMWNPVGWIQWPHHGLREHNRRITASKPVLENMHLNELYTRPDIVGQLVAQF